VQNRKRFTSRDDTAQKRFHDVVGDRVLALDVPAARADVLGPEHEEERHEEAAQLAGVHELAGILPMEHDEVNLVGILLRQVEK